ncbi:hypothetical protein PGTUg99_020808 [Puccinia graminis f. sp. tritici]|uniref:Uncharacterized protein n=1 Tax=Puccinia graminis f. sp. tritici TaxID=56615 RepID=A0A5B0SHW4_PUCGR|nr:hypothetical protein PGTUg99_020808 [Puccinia graminis f. sp. tritici]
MLDQEDPLHSLARILCSNFRSGGTDGNTQEDDSFARMLSSFRSSNPDRKTEEDYLEIIRDVIGHLHKRVGITRVMKMFEILQSESETLCQMEQIILPGLKEKLRSLSLAYNSPNSHNDAKCWYEAILNDLIKINNYLEQLEKSMGSPRRQDMSKKRIFPFRVGVVSRQIAHLFAGGLRPLFAACHTFFDQFSFSNPSTSRADQADEIGRLTTLSVEQIDAVFLTIQKPLLQVAKEEWKASKKLEELDPDAPDRDELLTEAEKAKRDQLSKVATPISKLFRIYFNQLSRSRPTQPLIFGSPSMEMKEDQLNLYFQVAQDTDDALHEFLDTSILEPTDRYALREVTHDLKDKRARLSRILETYWDSLLLKEDPRVNREAIAEARQWLESWSSLFFVATDKFMQVAGCRGLRR